MMRMEVPSVPLSATVTPWGALPGADAMKHTVNYTVINTHMILCASQRWDSISDRFAYTIKQHVCIVTQIQIEGYSFHYYQLFIRQKC